MAEEVSAGFESFAPTEKTEMTADDTYDQLGDIFVPVSIELGRTKMTVRDIVKLEKGDIIEFDKMAGETVDLLVNDKKFAEGEVVVIDEHFGIRITVLLGTQQVEMESR